MGLPRCKSMVTLDVYQPERRLWLIQSKYHFDLSTAEFKQTVTRPQRITVDQDERSNNFK